MEVLVCLGSLGHRNASRPLRQAEYVALADVMQVWRFMLPDVGIPCIPMLALGLRI